MKKAVLSVLLFVLLITMAGLGIRLTQRFIWDQGREVQFSERTETSWVDRWRMVSRALDILLPEIGEEEPAPSADMEKEDTNAV